MERERRESRRSAVAKEQRRKQLIRKRLIIPLCHRHCCIYPGNGNRMAVKGDNDSEGHRFERHQSAGVD